jgi:UDP-N-acetylmuramate dehydrogenase
MSTTTTPFISADVPLADHTTIGLGGKARFFASCVSVDQILDALRFAQQQRLPVHVLGGGSNVIFPDGGYPGLVLQVRLRGISVAEGRPSLVTASAGEPWDGFVCFCIDHDLTGVECLSGIPGFVGATPIQNVGAYGEEVGETIRSVSAIDRQSLQTVEFSAQECSFGYRSSRFKLEDANRYVITSVTFGLQRNAPAVIRYPELQHAIDANGGIATLRPGRPALSAIRAAVLTLRKKKSMVLDPADPNSRSVGSFFMNPVLSPEEFGRLERTWTQTGSVQAIPTFPASNGIKVPAAWLVEHAGFPRGFRQGGVGISSNHSLALVNYGGTTSELLALAEEIQRTVRDRFGVALEREPVVVTP